MERAVYVLLFIFCGIISLGALAPSSGVAQTAASLDVVVADLNADCAADTVRLTHGSRKDTAWLRVYWGIRDTSASCDYSWYQLTARTYLKYTTLCVAGMRNARYSGDTSKCCG